MTRTRASAVVALIALCCLPPAIPLTHAQASSEDAIARRVAELERTVRELTARIEALEAGAVAEVAPAAEPPSEEVIRTAAVHHLEQADPMPLEFTPTLMGCNKAKVDRFSVVEIGAVQVSGSRSYWPVRVKVTGACTTAFGKTVAFDKEGVFHVSQNPFGEWVATPGR